MLSGQVNANADFSEFDFGCCVLRGATFLNCVLRGARFHRACLDETYFEDCDFAGSVFVASEFVGTGFFDCRMDGARFVGCKGVVFVGSASQFERVRFVACTLDFICLHSIRLERDRWKVVASPVELTDGKLIESGRVQLLGEVRRIDSP